MNYRQICLQAIDVVKEVGNFIKEETSRFSIDDIETKSLNSFVTYIDKTAEEKIVKGLLNILPDAGFITEEETISRKGDEYNWIIDPLDGTTNFIHKVPLFSISVALTENSETVAGIVLEVNRNECFYTYKGGKAYLNDEVITVSGATCVSDSLIGTGLPYYNFIILTQYLAIIEELSKKSQGIRRFGSAAADLAYVACGRFDIFFEHGLHAWDVAAGAFLVKQAGGIITDFSEGENYLFGGEIIASNPYVYKEFQTIVKSKLH